jgi:hypothetical protein
MITSKLKSILNNIVLGVTGVDVQQVNALPFKNHYFIKSFSVIRCLMDIEILIHEKPYSTSTYGNHDNLCWRSN